MTGTKHGSFPIAAMLAMAGFATACGGFLKEKTVDWTAVEPGLYQYEDRDLALTFDHSKRGRFFWRFKNKRKQVLIIDHREIDLRKQGVTGTFTLWGKPKRDGFPYPRIELPRQKFINLTYPIQYNSAVYPVKTGDMLQLEFLARWGEKTRRYSVAIPAVSSSPSPDEDRKDP